MLNVKHSFLFYKGKTFVSLIAFIYFNTLSSLGLQILFIVEREAEKEKQLKYGLENITAKIMFDTKYFVPLQMLI